jgi:cell volume regulation protein A
VLGPTVFANPAVTQYLNITLVDVGQMGNIPDFLRTLALILVVFTGTFNLSMNVFKKYSDVSLNMAVAGVIFNTIFMGVFAHLIFGFDLVFSFLLGAVIGGTGSEVVFAFEKALSGSRNVLAILKVESILNSPLVVVFPILILDLMVVQPGSMIDPMKYASQFWLMVAAGVGTGLIIGYGISKLMGKMLKEYSVLLVLSVALLTFALAESVGGSGILAVAVCGLITGNMAFKHREEVTKFDDYFYEMLRISVFTLLGAQVMLSLTMEDFMLSLLFFALLFLSRPLFVIPILGRRRKSMTRKDVLILSLVGPKGIAAAAMAPLVTTAMAALGQPDVAAKAMNIIFLVIMLSVLSSTIVTKLVSGRGGRRSRARPGGGPGGGEDRGPAVPERPESIAA